MEPVKIDAQSESKITSTIMYHPSILHHLNQTYPSDNESTSDGVGGTAVRMTFNRIPGTVAYMRPLKLQASLRARDLAQY